MTVRIDHDRRPGVPVKRTVSQSPKPDARVIELEAKVTRLTEELKKLTQEKPIRPTEATGTRINPGQSLPVPQQRAVATASAEEGPRPIVTPVRDFQRPVLQNRPSFSSATDCLLGMRSSWSHKAELSFQSSGRTWSYSQQSVKPRLEELPR